MRVARMWLGRLLVAAARWVLEPRQQIDVLRGDMLTMTGRNYGCERESDSQYRDRILRKLGA